MNLTNERLSLYRSDALADIISRHFPPIEALAADNMTEQPLLKAHRLATYFES